MFGHKLYGAHEIVEDCVRMCVCVHNDFSNRRNEILTDSLPCVGPVGVVCVGPVGVVCVSSARIV